LATSFFPQNYIHDRLNLLGVWLRTHSAHKVLAEPKAMVRASTGSGAAPGDQLGYSA